MAGGSAQKRHLFGTWLERWVETNAVVVCRDGEPLRADAVLRGIASLPLGDASKEYLYVLLHGEGESAVPVYIGRAADPVSRWRGHLAGFARGVGVYSAWRRALLRPDGTAAALLRLVVIPVSGVTAPPIAGFPATVGALEYQLVGLASDAYPGHLLNHEGKAR
jgi:hypothetical protein